MSTGKLINQITKLNQYERTHRWFKLLNQHSKQIRQRPQQRLIQPPQIGPKKLVNLRLIALSLVNQLQNLHPKTHRVFLGLNRRAAPNPNTWVNWVI